MKTLPFKLVVKLSKGSYDKEFSHQSSAAIYVQDHCVGKPHGYLLATLYKDGVAIGWYDSKGILTSL